VRHAVKVCIVVAGVVAVAAVTWLVIDRSDDGDAAPPPPSSSQSPACTEMKDSVDAAGRALARLEDPTTDPASAISTDVQAVQQAVAEFRHALSLAADDSNLDNARNFVESAASEAIAAASAAVEAELTDAQSHLGAALDDLRNAQRQLEVATITRCR
jgi:hypothetical protein